MLTAEAATALDGSVSELTALLEATHIRPVLKITVSPTLRVL